MLRFYQSRTAREAISYYTEGLSREDYYAGDLQVMGEWGGLGAELLGLSGEVEKSLFADLAHNRIPGTKANLTPRTKTNRTVGYDVNFHAPKGVSVLQSLGKDDDIRRAFEASVEETLREMERDMQTRVRLDGLDTNRNTGNMVWASFTHFTARPVEGIPDPQLHRHAYVFNATHDPIEDRWKAGQFRELKRDAPYYQAAFYSRFADRLVELGYVIDRVSSITPGGRVGWDIAGVPAAVREKFSSRTAEIEKIAKSKGIEDAGARADLAAKTRKAKVKDMTVSELERHWDERLTESERERLFEVVQRSGSNRDRGDSTDLGTEPLTAKEAVDYAMGHCFERKSVESERRLIAEALEQSVGKASLEDIRQELHSRDILTREVEGRVFVTTPEILAKEQQMIAFARDSRGTCKALGCGYGDREGEKYEIQSEKLNEQQRAAIEHLLSSPDRVMMVTGKAGVGKSTAMKEAAKGIEECGKTIFAFAPSTGASRGDQRRAGFKNAETLAMLIKNESLQEKIRDQVIWIDEYAQAGVPTLCEALAIAEKLNARVILSGDRSQHGSVEWGDAARLLETYGGIRPAEIKEIIRQQGVYKDAVFELSKGRTENGFDLMDEQGWVVELDGDERHERLAVEYMETIAAGRTALVVSPTHAEGAAVTSLIRESLKESGRLASEERRVRRLVDLRLTEEEKHDLARYAEGLHLSFHQNVPGIKKGSNCRVVSAGRRNEEPVVVVENDRGQQLEVSLKHADRFGVYRETEMPVAQGERIRITRNGSTIDGKHRLDNGNHYDFKGINAEGNLELTNGWVVSKDFGHVAHAYCTTSHASQGKTVDRVFIAEGRESFAAASREQFYVSVSRGRHMVRVFTDDKKGLRNAIQKSGEDMTAVEMEQQPIPIKQQQVERAHHNYRQARQQSRMAVNAKTPALSRDEVARQAYRNRLQREQLERYRGR